MGEPAPPAPGTRYVSTLIQSGQSLGLASGRPDQREAQWFIVTIGDRQYLRNVATQQYLVVSPEGNISFTPNIESGGPVALTTGVTRIITSTGSLGIEPTADRRVRVLPISENPRTLWNVALAR